MPTHNHGATTANGGHSHDRGSMEIWGSLRDNVVHDNSALVDGGAFTISLYSGARYSDGIGSGNTANISFVASRTWSGATSTVANHTHETLNSGNSDAHNNMQPYLAVAIWKRTA